MNRTDIIKTNERSNNYTNHASDQKVEDDETMENLYLINSQIINSLYEYLEFLKQYDEELEKQ